MQKKNFTKISVTTARKYRRKVHDIGLRHDVMDMTPKLRPVKPRIDNCNYIKLKSSLTQRKYIHIANRQSMELD